MRHTSLALPAVCSSSYFAMSTLMYFIRMTSSVKGPQCLDWFMLIYSGKHHSGHKYIIRRVYSQYSERHVVATLGTVLIYWNINWSRVLLPIDQQRHISNEASCGQSRFFLTVRFIFRMSRCLCRGQAQPLDGRILHTLPMTKNLQHRVYI